MLIIYDISHMKTRFIPIRQHSLMFIFVFLFFSGWVSSQEILDFQIAWNGFKKVASQNKEILIPSIKDQEPDNGKPVFYAKQKLKTHYLEIELVSFETEAAPVEDVSYLKKFYFDPTEQIQIEMNLTNEKHQPFAVVHLFPYLLENGSVRRITSLKVKLHGVKLVEKQSKNFVSQSVLREGSGLWYKISVANDGIYKIDKTFLEACGISVFDLNPDAIHVFGNGDGKLPETNGEPRSDDLVQNAIHLVGGEDGSFDSGDYILFYGWGPNRWRANGLVEMDQDKNIYSDISCYFININSKLPPLKIINKSSLIVNPTHNISSYNFCDIHELDLVNLVGGGQRWYGELFDADLEQTFTFKIPNIDNLSKVDIKTTIATNSNSSSGTDQEYSVNGTILSTSPLPVTSSDYVRSTRSLVLNSPSANIPLKIKISRNSPNTVVYLDRIVLNARRKLMFLEDQFNFRDLNSVGVGNISNFTIQNFPVQGFVWDVTDRHHPYIQLGTFSGTDFSFVTHTDTIREFVASKGVNYLTPSPLGPVSNQNLHALSQAELLIISHPDFINQALRLAALHEETGTTTHVVTTDQIFNEFSSGMKDPVALRMFIKMFYDRSISNPTSAPQNVLLFGDGTYDPKNRLSNNNNYILTYQALTSENHISALVTDDFYAMLDEGESIKPTDLMDVGVGRLLVSNIQMAKEQVDKIDHYLKNGSNLFSSSNSNFNCSENGYSSTFGDWRTNYVQIADDEEGGYFITQDTEPQYEEVKTSSPEMNCDKLYCDAFKQVATAGGERYPDVFNAITERIERGALVVNYVGHGGEVGLAEERIVTVPQIQSWGNIDRLNLFVSATCEFTKYDDPSRVSAGEWVALNPTGGAIALMTTSRSVFFGVNTLTGLEFFENVFSRDANAEPLTLGEIMRRTKNGSGSSDNKRSFTLIGDPALKLALPRLRIVTDSINGLSPDVQLDTLRALSRVTVKGHIENWAGSVLNDFSGTVIPSIFDKPKVLSTLGQNDDSPVIDFELQKNVVYRGKATVQNGYFSFSFVVPKDINYSFGNGKISYYANSALTDASGSDNRFLIGGVDTVALNDTQGPDIDLFINDDNFVSGGMTDETPVLLAKLYDENGINTVGNGIGHDLTVILDGKTAEPIVLNDYYTADLDSYQSGEVRYTFPALEKGKHTLTFKVWDVNNNSSEKTIEFNVQERQQLSLDHVLNYPNPFTTRTTFYFEHNQVCSQLEAQVQIFTVAGRLVRTINQTVNTVGFRSQGIEWDGKDDFGDQLAKGVYVYSVKVNSPDGQKAEKIEKLVLLR
jgi:hypothetical protein